MLKGRALAFIQFSPGQVFRRVKRSNALGIINSVHYTSINSGVTELPDIMMNFLFIFFLSALFVAAKDDHADEHESKQSSYDGSGNCPSSV